MGPGHRRLPGLEARLSKRTWPLEVDLDPVYEQVRTAEIAEIPFHSIANPEFEQLGTDENHRPSRVLANVDPYRERPDASLFEISRTIQPVG